MPLTPPLDAVIFDLDGVLLDTEPLYTEASSRIAAEYGKEFDWSVKQAMMGRGHVDAARIFTERLGLPISPEEYIARSDEILRELFAATKPILGAPELVAALHARRVPLAVATSTPESLYRQKTRPHPWFSQFRALVCGDDPEVRESKPAPDIFLVAAKRLGVAAERCVIVEDSPNGVLAARRAGAQVIALPDERLSDESFADVAVVARSHRAVQDALFAVFAENA